MARYEDLPYRTCVGMMLINAAGLVFIGRRAGGIEHVDESHVWQMPQGGVDPGEDTWAAAKRGLGYFDDGLAPRSVAPSLAAAQAMPFAKADLSIDVVPTAVEIDRALAKLEALAKEHGVAVGTASALPISIERISLWIKALEGHGILLVPLTTAMLKSKSG